MVLLLNRLEITIIPLATPNLNIVKNIDFPFFKYGVSKYKFKKKSFSNLCSNMEKLLDETKNFPNMKKHY